MLGYRLVEQRAFGVAWVVELGLEVAGMNTAQNAQYSAAIVWYAKHKARNRRQFGALAG